MEVSTAFSLQSYSCAYIKTIAIDKSLEILYTYRKDAYGNVIALLDTSGAVVVKYTYDAWGNNVVSNANNVIISDVNHIGNLNPFRYRGYYYDTDLGLYYLKTRYYDAETGRFISPDSPKYLAPEILNGLNLYAYCGNNPVMNIDPNGNAWWEWVLGALAVVGITALTAGAAYLVAGAVIGTAAASAAATGAVIGGLTLGGAELVSQGVSSDWGNLDWGSLAIETVSGSVYGAMRGMLYSTPNPILQRTFKVWIIGLAGVTEGVKSVKSGDSFWETAFNMATAMGMSWGAMQFAWSKRGIDKFLTPFQIDWKKIGKTGMKSVVKLIKQLIEMFKEGGWLL